MSDNAAVITRDEHVTRLTPEGARVVTELLSSPVDKTRHARLASCDPLPSHDDPLVVACDRYLEAKKCQLWGQFSIARVDDRWDAACWLAEQVRAVCGPEVVTAP